MMPVPWRLVGAVTLTAAVALAGWRVSAWHEAYKALPGLEAAIEREEGCLDGSHCYERQRALQAAAEAATKEVVDDYEKELADVRARALVRRVIRVCRDSDLQNASPAGGAGTGTPSERVVHGADEFDTAPLRDLAQRADELSAQCRALIRWNVALAAE